MYMLHGRPKPLSGDNGPENGIDLVEIGWAEWSDWHRSLWIWISVATTPSSLIDIYIYSFVKSDIYIFWVETIVAGPSLFGPLTILVWPSPPLPLEELQIFGQHYWVSLPSYAILDQEITRTFARTRIFSIVIELCCLRLPPITTTVIVTPIHPSPSIIKTKRASEYFVSLSYLRLKIVFSPTRSHTHTKRLIHICLINYI